MGGGVGRREATASEATASETGRDVDGDRRVTICLTGDEFLSLRTKLKSINIDPCDQRLFRTTPIADDYTAGSYAYTTNSHD